MLYILIIITHVNSGSAVHSIEFESKTACDVAQDKIHAAWVEQKVAVEYLACVPKGSQP